MPDAYLMEDGVSFYLQEDGSSLYLMEDNSVVTAPGRLVLLAGLASQDNLFHLRYPNGDAPVGPAIAGSALVAASATGALTTGSGSTGQLAAGHYVAAKMAAAVVYPRPDSETGAYTGTVIARHRWAYYDGVNAVEYHIPIGVQGGARPYIWSLIAAPPGATIGNNYTSAYPGVVRWTPNQAYSTSSPASFTVQGQDQQGNTITISWTVATTSATSQFIFIDSVNGNDTTGAGSISAPFKTLAKVMGGTPTTTTYPGANVYMRAGSYQWPLQTGTTVTGGTGLDYTHNPICYMAFPGESVSIDASIAQLYDSGTGCTDLFFGGSATSRLAIVGSSATALDTHTFELYNPSRCTWFNIDFTGPTSRANGNNTNSTSIFGYNDSSGGVVGKNYWFVYGCTETGRAAGASNSMLLVAWFSLSNFVIEYSKAVGYAGFGPFLKDSNQNGTVYNSTFGLLSDSGGDAFCFGGQEGESPAIKSQNLEICYCFVYGGAVKFDFQGGATCGPMYSYRNTILNNFGEDNWGLGSNAPAGQGPFSSDGDVIVARSPGGIQTNGSVAFTTTGTEVQVAWSGSSYATPANCPINTTTGALVDVSGGTSWRTTYRGIRGCEIA